MFKKSQKNVAVPSEGRVLGRVLSREEVLQVGGGASISAEPTDAWVDKGTCTPTSDKGATSPIAQ